MTPAPLPLTVEFVKIGIPHCIARFVNRHGLDHKLTFVPYPPHNIDHAATIIAGDMRADREAVADIIRKAIQCT